MCKFAIYTRYPKGKRVTKNNKGITCLRLQRCKNGLEAAVLLVLSVQVKSLLSIHSQSTLVVLTRYNRVSFNVSIFSPTGNQFDLLNSETLSKITLETSLEALRLK